MRGIVCCVEVTQSPLHSVVYRRNTGVPAAVVRSNPIGTTATADVGRSELEDEKADVLFEVIDTGPGLEG